MPAPTDHHVDLTALTVPQLRQLAKDADAAIVARQRAGLAADEAEERELERASAFTLAQRARQMDEAGNLGGIA